MKNENFLLVNHKNSMETFDINTLCQTKTNLFLLLGANENHISLKSQINKILSSIMDINYLIIEKEDQLDIIYRLINLYYQKAEFDINNQSYCNDICKKLASNDYNTELNLHLPLMKDIAIVLSFGFVNLAIKYTFDQRLDYPGFIALINDIREDNIGIIKEYSNNINRNNGNRIQENIPLAYEFDVINNQQQFSVSNELLLLLNIFSSIKTIIISMNDCSEIFLLSFLLLILNYEWLFTDVLTISYDISCSTIQKELLILYKTDINSNHKKRKKSQPKKSFWKKEKSDSHLSINDWVQSNNISELYQKFFAMIPLVSDFIFNVSHLQNLTLIIPDSFKTEIDDCLNKMKIPFNNTPSFNFLQLYLPFQHLLSLIIEFNCLELSSFEIILGIINNNINLRHLSLSLFSKEEEYYYYSSIYRTVSNENITLVPLSSSSSSQSVLFSSKNIEEEDPELNCFSYNLSDYSLIENEQLIQGFERNLEHLFILLLTKKTLSSIHLEFDIPGIISNNEKYYFIIIKFVFNIFILLNNNKAKHITEIKLIAPCLRFDNRKYPLIEQFFDGIDLYNKNNRLTSLTIQFQISELSNLSNGLSTHLQYLFIGDLDLDSFKAFISFYKRDDFTSRSKLCTLILSLNSTLFDYFSFKDDIKELIKGSCPKNLKEIGFHCLCSISAFDLKTLMDFSNGNQIERYMFCIKQISQNEYTNFNYGRFYYYDYSYSLNDKKNKWIILQVLHSLRVLNKKTFDLILLMLNRGFVIQKIKKKKNIEIQFK